MRLFLVDDHEIVLEGLRLMFGQQPMMQIVGSACNCSRAWTLIAESRPDIVLMDVDVPGEGGLALTARIVESFPEIKVIVLTGQSDSTLANSALRAGARGFVLKLEAGAELILAIEAVIAGELYVSPKVATLVAEEVRRQFDVAGGPKTLSAREVEIVRRIADGQSTKEIAFELQVSTKTVETHRLNLMKKIGANGVAELTKFAVRAGLTKL